MGALIPVQLHHGQVSWGMPVTDLTPPTCSAAMALKPCKRAHLQISSTGNAPVPSRLAFHA